MPGPEKKSDVSRLRASLRFLAQVSDCLAAFDTAAGVGSIVRLAVPAIADLAIADLVLDSGALHRVESAFADAGLAAADGAALGAPCAHEGTALGFVLRSREPLLVGDQTAATRGTSGLAHDPLVEAARPHSVMYVPIVTRGRVFGIYTFGASARPAFTGTDLATARDLAARTGLAIENARLREQAERAIGARQELVSFALHDLRSPLMGITISVDAILRAAPGLDRRKSGPRLERIRRATLDMQRTIEDLLAVTSLETGRLNVDIAPHEAGKLLAELRESFAPVAIGKKIALEVVVPAAPIKVACDSARVVKVLMNLVDNAIKFTPENGRVVVSMRAERGSALFAVQDTGSGIPADALSSVFEPAQQLSRKAYRGRGLGLYVAKGLVEAQHGSIWVDSKEGSGTTFSFRLPLARAGAVDRTEPESVRAAQLTRE